MYDGKIGVIELYVGYIALVLYILLIKKSYQITNNSEHLINPVGTVIFHVAKAETFCEFK
jgi:hypothetical protein